MFVCLFVCLSVCLSVTNRRENYRTDQDETFNTYSLRPWDGSAQKKKIEKIQKGARGGPFFVLKNAFFSNISIIYDPIELKLSQLSNYTPAIILKKEK